MARDQNPQGDKDNRGLVFDNLGMTGDDLGIDNEPDFTSDADSGDAGGDADGDYLGPDQSELDSQLDAVERPERRQQPDKSRRRSELDDLRVTHTGLPRRAEVKPDGKGNLVNANGQIVARAGKEARLYQDAHKARTQLDGANVRVQDLSTKLRRAVDIGKELHGELGKLQAMQQQIKDFGIKPDQMMLALSLFRDLDTKPAETLKRLLTRAKMNGINVDDGTGGGGNGGRGLFGTEAPALGDLIREELGKHLAPLRQQTDEQRRREEADRNQQRGLEDTQAEVNDWFARNPEALRYAPVIQRLLENPANRNRSLGELWLEIQLNLERRQRSNGTPLQGRRPGSGSSQPPTGNSDMAPVNQDYDQILRDVISEHGIR